jgi:poly(A) polymerase Pap1
MKQTAAFHGGYIELGRFSRRFEATSKQTGYINSLCRQLGISLETAHERLFGMPCVVAYTDRPWLCLTRGEASKLIDRLKTAIAAKQHADRIEAQETARESYKNALEDHNADPVQGSEPPGDRELDSMRIECPF